jgi:hypothetical protein
MRRPPAKRDGRPTQTQADSAVKQHLWLETGDA